MTDSEATTNDTPQRPLYAVVLAAGEGSRMKSERPKPLHRQQRVWRHERVALIH